jgi:hypothetical protein
MIKGEKWVLRITCVLVLGFYLVSVLVALKGPHSTIRFVFVSLLFVTMIFFVTKSSEMRIIGRPVPLLKLLRDLPFTIYAIHEENRLLSVVSPISPRSDGIMRIVEFSEGLTRELNNLGAVKLVVGDKFTLIDEECSPLLRIEKKSGKIQEMRRWGVN